MAATDIHIRQLTHFLAVVEEGSFGKAAQRVHLSQPALSKSVRQLEERLQVKLIDRTAQGVIPTVFGIAFVEHARSIRSEITNAVNVMDALRGVRRGVVSVGVGPSVASTVLPEAISRLMRTHSDVTVNVMEGLSNALAPALLCGEVDLVLAARLGVDHQEELVLERLYVDRCAIICTQDHPLLQQVSPTLQDLRAYPWMLTGKNESLRLIFDEIFRANGLDPPVPLVNTNSLPFMMQILPGSDLLGFLPRVLVRAQLAAGQLAELDHPECRWDRPMFMVHRRRRSVAPLTRSLMRIIREVCADYGLGG